MTRRCQSVSSRLSKDASFAFWNKLAYLITQCSANRFQKSSRRIFSVQNLTLQHWAKRAYRRGMERYGRLQLVERDKGYYTRKEVERKGHGWSGIDQEREYVAWQIAYNHKEQQRTTNGNQLIIHFDFDNNTTKLTKRCQFFDWQSR